MASMRRAAEMDHSAADALVREEMETLTEEDMERQSDLLGALRLEASRFQTVVQEALDQALHEHLRQQEQLLASCSPPCQMGPKIRELRPARPGEALLLSNARKPSARRLRDVVVDPSPPPVPELAPAPAPASAPAPAPVPVAASGGDGSEAPSSLVPSDRPKLERARSASHLHEVHAAHGSKVHALLLQYFRPSLEWYWSLEEPQRDGCMARFLTSQWFSHMLAASIFANNVISSAMVNYDVRNEDVPTSLQVWDAAFVTFFAVEVAVKIWTHGLFFFVGADAGWNLFDFTLVILSVLQFVLEQAAEAAQQASQVTFLRVIRALRVTRALRGLRFFRVFAELRLMLNCVIGSLSSMFWSCVMLLFTMWLFSVFILQLLQPDFHDAVNWGPVSMDDESALVKYFGSVQSSMLTLYTAAMGGQDWEIYLDVLPGFIAKTIFVLFICFFQVTVMNILTGIYVEAAMKHAAPDRQTRAKDVLVQRIEDRADLREFCCKQGVIVGEDGRLTSVDDSAFRAACHDEHFMAYLATFGINSSNPDELYSCLLDLGVTSDVDALVDGLLKLREPATNYDMERVAQRTRAILAGTPAVGRSCCVLET